MKRWSGQSRCHARGPYRGSGPQFPAISPCRRRRPPAAGLAAPTRPAAGPPARGRMAVRLQRRGGNVEIPLDAVGVERRASPRRPASGRPCSRARWCRSRGARTAAAPVLTVSRQTRCNAVPFQAPGDAERPAVDGEGAVLDGVGRQLVGRHAQDLRRLGVEPQGRPFEHDPAAIDRAEAVDLVGEQFAEVDAADAVRQQQVGRTGEPEDALLEARRRIRARSRHRGPSAWPSPRSPSSGSWSGGRARASGSAPRPRPPAGRLRRIGERPRDGGDLRDRDSRAPAPACRRPAAWRRSPARAPSGRSAG